MNGVRLRATSGGIDRDVTVRPDRLVTVDGQPCEVDAIGPGTWRVTLDGRARVVYVVSDEDGCWVHADGQVHRVELASAGVRGRRRTGAGEHALSAPMPATVLSVMVEIGQAVAAGETVLMLEAMKMELPVRAPKDGTVAAVHCREGELVQPGVPLVELA